ncbi:MAG TPA: GNAT family N-acetyltransferase [Candidatus Woesebacteria bacterium]|nr:GNAT family N-acetyltransferase [Candidatus Woesebacteria bacterium]
MNFEIEIFREFGKLEEGWWRLLPAAATNTIFQTPVFQQTWWETLGEGELYIVTVKIAEEKQRQNHQLVCIAPFFIHNRTLKLIGCKAVSDYLDLIANVKFIDQIYPLVADKIAELFSQGQINSVELCSLPEESATLTLLPNLIKHRLPKIKVLTNEQDVCPVIKLPKTFDQYLALLARKQRHEVRRKLRKLEAEVEYSVETISDPNKISIAVDEFIRLHQLSSSDKHDFWIDEHRQFFIKLLPKLAEKGWLKLFFLYLKNWRENSFNLPSTNQPVSAMLVFDYTGTYSLYNSGYDPTYWQLSVGQVLTALTIADAIKQGKHTYDFLRGREEYKIRLGGKSQPICDLTLTL